MSFPVFNNTLGTLKNWSVKLSSRFTAVDTSLATLLSSVATLLSSVATLELSDTPITRGSISLTTSAVGLFTPVREHTYLVIVWFIGGTGSDRYSMNLVSRREDGNAFIQTVGSSGITLAMAAAPVVDAVSASGTTNSGYVIIDLGWSA